MRFFVVLGLPGSGKGTQAKVISKILGLPHISSGELFRQNFKNQTPLGKAAQVYLSKGELVPDELTIEMIEKRLSGIEGAILDGFPRTENQANALDQMIGGKVQATLHIEVPIDRMIDRMGGRRVCRENGHVYHIEHNPPVQEDICDIDGSELYQRDDDLPETVRHRVKIYQRQTEPLVDFYREQGVLITIDGDQPIDTVTEDILVALEDR